MDQVHGVDVSWLHTPNKEHHHRKTAPSTPGLPQDTKPPTSSNGGIPPTHHQRQASSGNHTNGAPTPVTPPSLSEAKQSSTVAHPSTPTPSTNGAAKGPPAKRPTILSRASSDRSDPKPSRRPSWINNISSKFSSSQTTPQATAPVPQQQPTSPPQTNGSTAAGAQKSSEEAENVEPYVPSRPKDSTSFFSNLTRRLSSAGSQSTGIPRVQGNGGVCARKVLNVDPNRERCLVPELDQNRLRRVSFCVDVEIAGGPRYRDDAEDDGERKRKKKDVKMKERAEGEALKHPEALKDEKEQDDEVKIEAKSKPVPVPGDRQVPQKDTEDKDDERGSPPVGSLDDGSGGTTRKKEKKKRSEAERKERKEKKLRRAQENGSIPVEMMAADEDDSKDASPTATPPNSTSPAIAAPQATPAKQDRPTTDPVRIYRRCCQLRETPILKRITEQLSSPKCVLTTEPGVVGCLDLTGSRLQLADVVTLGDWLAVVPVKRLILEDADLNDEGVRVVLAGLLAAKRPEPSRRKTSSPKHRSGVPSITSQPERSGIVEKITFKNNPRITRVGWKHISLFIYMCRSIKAIDISMNQFPDTFPGSAQATPVKNSDTTTTGKAIDTDAAETLYKCLSERLGGSRLEELSLSECGLTAAHIRKITDGATMCGISRLGLAGNNLTDEGLGHIIRYLRSGVCHGLDLGGNDLRGKLGPICEAFVEKQIPCWGLSLAGCNLDTASVKPLFPALVKLPNFRFLDLSHNRDLCGEDNGTISIIRRYLGQMKDFKRLHFNDVGMNAKQAIKLAEVLPEGPKLAHVSIQENPQLTALANATDEAGQEEACALYASLMVAVRVSSTLMYIDIDVPSADNNEIVKALAKQIVAYSLRNMERTTLSEVTGEATANATATITAPHGGEAGVKDLVVPDVLMHLVGHMEGTHQNADNEDPAPDDDYIVGGTGVVKALQYVLGDKGADRRRSSIPTTPTGAMTPRGRPGSSAGLEQEGKAKAKQMSVDLLDSARKIRTRLQPAIVKEATAGNEMAYRRLLFLDQTLQSMIQRFEEEYPETRVAPVSSSDKPRSLASSTGSVPLAGEHEVRAPAEQGGDDEDEDEDSLRPPMARHNSDASLASRALTLEEGRLHRLGQHLRREVVKSNPSSANSSPVKGTPTTGGQIPLQQDAQQQQQTELDEAKRLAAVQEKLESTPGEELRQAVEAEGWQEVLKKVGANYDDLRALQEQDPEGWEQFKASQTAARLNTERA